MKYQGQYSYQLRLDFESPIRDFFEDPDNQKTINEVIQERLDPKYPLQPKSMMGYFLKCKMICEIGLCGTYDDGILQSGLFLIIEKISDNFVSKLPVSFDTSVIVNILKGEMLQKYYTTGSEGEVLMDMVDLDHEGKKDKKCLDLFEILVPFYTEEDEDSSNDSDDLCTAIDKMSSGDFEGIEGNEIKALNNYWSKEDRIYKFSSEGIDLLQKKGSISEKMISGFEQIRIIRESNATIVLVIAVMTVVYFKKELFLYYNPRLFQLGICDKENLNYESIENYVVVNFSNIVDSLFCSGCLQKKNDNARIVMESEIKGNPDLIKEMMSGLLDQLMMVCPDDVEISFKGKVDDTKRINEIDEKLPNAEYVGFVKHSGDKKSVTFEINDNLKNFKKRINRK